MFTRRASPFNSTARQLYGGWSTTATAKTPVASLQGTWDASAPLFLQDTKWANMAERYSMDPDDRAIASAIKAASKGYLKRMRAEAKRGTPSAMGWVARYNAAAKLVRNPYRLTGLSPAQRHAVFTKFKSISWDPAGLSDSNRLFLSMANRAPFQSAPNLPDGIQVDGMGNFITGNAGYALPIAMDTAEKKRLAIARHGVDLYNDELYKEATDMFVGTYNVTPGNDKTKFDAAVATVSTNYPGINMAQVYRMALDILDTD